MKPYKVRALRERIDALVDQRAERMRMGNFKYLRSMRRQREYLDAVHDFELYRGDTTFGRKKTMTGHEAAADNRRFEDFFFKTKRADARMLHWKLADNDPYVVARREQAARKRKVSLAKVENRLRIHPDMKRKPCAPVRRRG